MCGKSDTADIGRVSQFFFSQGACNNIRVDSMHFHSLKKENIIIIIIYSLTARVIGTPQMNSQAVSFIFLCSPLPSGTWQTPGLSIPRCLPTSFPVCLVFFPLLLCLARWFWPDLMNGRHDHTIAVCVSLRMSGSPRVVILPA